MTIDTSINLYSLILVVIMVVSGIYALGQYFQKLGSSTDRAASKSDIESIKESMGELKRRTGAIERNMVQKGEFMQFQARLESFERNMNARLDDRP